MTPKLGLRKRLLKKLSENIYMHQVRFIKPVYLISNLMLLIQLQSYRTRREGDSQKNNQVAEGVVKKFILKTMQNRKKKYS